MVEDPRSWDDAALARRCAARQDAAWEELLRRAGPAAQGVMRRLFARAGLPDPAREAEEALGAWAQALLQRGAASLKAYRPPTPLKAYLKAVAHHVAVSVLRKRRRVLSLDAAPAGASPLKDLLEAPGEGAPGCPVAPGLLEEALGRLSTEDALMLRLVYWDGHPLAEVARLMDIPPGSLGPLMTRARAALRQALIARDPE